MAELHGVRVEIVAEAYTSKTFGVCGELNNALGSNRTFSRGGGGYTADRDENAARKSLLRNLSLVFDC